MDDEAMVRAACLAESDTALKETPWVMATRYGMRRRRRRRRRELTPQREWS